MKNNSKGFTLVELLAVIAILGILMGLAIQAYSMYKKKAVNQSYETMSSNSASAAEEYFMDHMAATSVDFETLVKQEYLSDTVDPLNSSGKCTGTVMIMDNQDGDSKKVGVVTLGVKMKCANFESCIIYPEKEECDASQKNRFH